MSTNPDRLFAALRSDTFGTAAPAVLRQIGDRRGRVRFALIAGAAIVVAVILVGSALGLGQPNGLFRPPVGGTRTPAVVTATPPLPPTPTSADETTEPAPVSCDVAQPIPYTAFLQPDDGTDTDPNCAEAFPEDRLPLMCRSLSIADDGQVIAHRSIQFFIHRTDPGAPTDVTPALYLDQTIERYSGDGASLRLASFERAVKACPTVQGRGGPLHNRVIGHGVAGDESFLMSVTFKMEMGGTTFDKADYVAVVRVRDTVTVLYGHGWEEASADRALVQLLAKRAATRLNAWHP